MLFNSLQFLVFFPIAVLVYFVLPHRVRYLWLLVLSYYFYMCWNPQYALLLLFSTFITYLSGQLIDRSARKELAGLTTPGERKAAKRTMSKLWVALSFAINLAILVFFKYFGFIVDNIKVITDNLGVSWTPPSFSVLLPVGISFYIFQALSFTVDVYRGDVRAERNFFKYAVFVSFFPQLVAGPIERSSNLLGQFDEEHHFSYDNMKNGLLMMLWGFFQKVVVADTAAVVVNQIFDYYPYYQGFVTLLGCLLFAVQIYGDFAGYSNIAIGAAQVMGFSLMQNFKEPYLSCSIGEFWRRWHISLSSWFRDYLYIPLGGNRKGKGRKYFNLMVVFLTSGLWHGASWNYVIWGGLNGIYQVIGSELKPVRQKWLERIGAKTQSVSYKIMQMLITFVLIDIAWVFFRAPDLTSALGIFRQMFSAFNPWVLIDGTLFSLGISEPRFWWLLICVVVMLVVGIVHYRGIHIREIVARQQIWLRWGLYILAIFTVLLMGAYGPDFDAAAFIYFQF